MQEKTATVKNYFLAILFFLLPRLGFASDEISIEILNAPQHIKPGEYFTLFIEIKSNYVVDPTFSTSMALPEHWQVLAKNQPDINKNAGNQKYVYTIAVPRMASAGEYVIALKAWEKGLSKASKDVKLQVEKVRKVEITPLDYPEYLREGETLKVEYLVQNAGNGKENIELHSSRGKIAGPKSAIVLEKNESIKVEVTQLIATSEENMWLVNTDLKVSFGDTSQPVHHLLTIPAYATKNKKSDPYLRFPVEGGIIYHTFRSAASVRQGFQYELKGAGNLDFERKHSIDFIARNANQFGYAAIGAYEQYSFNYAYKRENDRISSIALGDYNLMFSHLIELNRFGRGVKIDHQFGRSGMSVFYQEPRFYRDTKQNIGGSYTFKPLPTTTLGVNLLHKNHIYNNRPLQTELLSTSLQVRNEYLWWDAELAASHTSSKLGFGAFSSLNFFRKRIRFYNNIVFAGNRFYGFYTNSRLFNTSLYYAITPKITLGGVMNYSRVNPGLDSTIYSQSPYFMSNVAELTLRPNNKNRIVLSYNQLHREDRANTKRFDFKEDFLRYAYFLNTNRFNLWLDGNYGYSQNLLVSPDASSRRLSIRNLMQMQVTIVRGLTLGPNIEYLRTNRYSPQNELQDFVFYGGTLRVQLKKYFDLSVMYRNNYTIDELTEKRMFFDVQANLRFNHHQLSLVGSQAYYPILTEQNTLYFGVKYSLNINLPIAKSRNLGSIKGQITGASNVRKAGVLLQIGDQKFVSDKNGFFMFNSLVPNKYYITLVRSSMQEGDIPVRSIPIEVDVRANSNYIVKIPFAKSGRIVGKVLLEKAAQIRNEQVNNALPDILVKLYNERESYTTKVNSDGIFSFKEVKPGSWNVMLWIPGNPKTYVIDNSNSTIEVKEKSSHELTFTIKAVERKIHFTENNFYLGAKE